MGFTIERQEFTKIHNDEVNSAPGLVQSLMSDLSDNGFNLVFPTGSVGIEDNTPVAVFDSDTAMDPLGASEPFRIRIEGTPTSGLGSGNMKVNIGTNLQIPGDGTEVSKTDQIVGNQTTGTPITSGFLMGNDKNQQTSGGNNDVPPFLSEQYFYGKPNQNTPTEEPANGPISYRLSISSHGVAFCAWKNGADDDGDMFAWFVAQRPVDPSSGAPLVDSSSPVFCVYSTGGGGHDGGDIQKDGISKFVVRETDVFAPTFPVSAVVASEDNNPILNPMRQVSISTDNKYIITFPSNLNTQRRAYKHELDMIAYTSADVVSHGSDVSVTVFGEADPRTYKAMNANSPFNTGMRILLLTDGASVAPPTNT